MADRKNNNVPNTSSNLLFSAAPEFNFSLPFMPVSQATGPALLSGEDSNDVGEEDSFLGQTSGNGPAASTFNYFSSPVTSSDPFASIGQSPCPPPALSAAPPSMGPVSVPSSVSMAPPPSAHMQAPAFGGAVYQSPMGRQTPPPNTMTPPPPQMQPQSHNPYRHTATSSRASPYIPAPEVLPPNHTPPQIPYSYSSPPQAFPMSGPAFTKVPGHFSCLTSVL
uniref:SEC23 interacting protein n=1 Tax=Sphaeramia orbicularis TaxID=375764 RepID=A0A673B5L8_9TELE